MAFSSVQVWIHSSWFCYNKGGVLNNPVKWLFPSMTVLNHSIQCLRWLAIVSKVIWGVPEIRLHAQCAISAQIILISHLQWRKILFHESFLHCLSARSCLNLSCIAKNRLQSCIAKNRFQQWNWMLTLIMHLFISAIVTLANEFEMIITHWCMITLFRIVIMRVNYNGLYWCICLGRVLAWDSDCLAKMSHNEHSCVVPPSHC